MKIYLTTRISLILSSVTKTFLMDHSYLLECRRQDMIMPTPKSTMKSIPCASSTSPQFEINFVISGKHIYREWILSPNRAELVPAGVVELPTSTKSIRFNLQITTSPKERMLDALKQGMEDFPLGMERGEGLAKYAAETAWNIVVYFMSPSHNQLNLYIDFIVHHKHILHEEEEQESDGPNMIPTSEAYIESLETNVIDSSYQNTGESCLICLEYYGMGCKIICMPCSHVFHGDCIKTWLRINHYCPICRFQMPIDN